MQVKGWSRWCGLAALLALWTACLGASLAEAAVQYRWVQLVEGETLSGILQPRVLVRAIIDQAMPARPCSAPTARPLR